MKEKFHSYWETYIRDHGSDLGITIQMLPFCKYTIDVVKSNDKGMDNLEIEIFPLQDFLAILDKAKEIAIQCAKEDEERKNDNL